MNSAPEPLVSIMIPAYNAEKTLPLSIGSVLSQTYSNWRCIIINDGSVDGTKAYLDTITDPRFQVIHLQENFGRPYARQKALDLAVGKYLAFLDADDFYHPEKIERQVAVLEAHSDVYLVSCGMGSFDAEFILRNVRTKRPFLRERYSINMELIPARAASMIRLEAAKQVRYNMVLKFAQDTDYFSRYLNNREYIITNEVLYYYSEFVSVSGTKILQTYWYSLVHIFKDEKMKPLVKLTFGVKILFKILVTVTLMPLLGKNFFLSRRGGQPTQDERQEFSEVLQLLIRLIVKKN